MQTDSIPEQAAEQPSCKGWAIRDGIIVLCPEPFTPNKGNTKRCHSRGCQAETKRLKDRGFALDDRYTKICQNPKCPRPERKFTPENTFLQDYCTPECRTQANYWRRPERLREAAIVYYREHRDGILEAHANPTPAQLEARHKVERKYRITHKNEREIQAAQRFIKKHGHVALTPDLSAKLADADAAEQLVLDLQAQVDAARQRLADKEAQLAKAKLQSSAKDKEEKQYFKIGKLVDEKMARGKALTAARSAVAAAEGIAYSSVSRYHKQYRAEIGPPG